MYKRVSIGDLGRPDPFGGGDPVVGSKAEPMGGNEPVVKNSPEEVQALSQSWESLMRQSVVTDAEVEAFIAKVRESEIPPSCIRIKCNPRVDNESYDSGEYSMLGFAIAHNHESAINTLVNSGMLLSLDTALTAVQGSKTVQCSALFLAAERGNERAIASLASLGIEIKDDLGRVMREEGSMPQRDSALQVVCRTGNEQVIDTMLQSFNLGLGQMVQIRELSVQQKFQRISREVNSHWDSAHLMEFEYESSRGDMLRGPLHQAIAESDASDKAELLEFMKSWGYSQVTAEELSEEFKALVEQQNVVDTELQEFILKVKASGVDPRDIRILNSNSRNTEDTVEHSMLGYVLVKQQNSILKGLLKAFGVERASITVRREGRIVREMSALYLAVANLKGPALPILAEAGVDLAKDIGVREYSVDGELLKESSALVGAIKGEQAGIQREFLKSFGIGLGQIVQMSGVSAKQKCDSINSIMNNQWGTAHLIEVDYISQSGDMRRGSLEEAIEESTTPDKAELLKLMVEKGYKKKESQSLASQWADLMREKDITGDQIRRLAIQMRESNVDPTKIRIVESKKRGGIAWTDKFTLLGYALDKKQIEAISILLEEFGSQPWKKGASLTRYKEGKKERVFSTLYLAAQLGERAIAALAYAGIDYKKDTGSHSFSEDGQPLTGVSALQEADQRSLDGIVDSITRSFSLSLEYILQTKELSVKAKHRQISRIIGDSWGSAHERRVQVEGVQRTLFQAITDSNTREDALELVTFMIESGYQVTLDEDKRVVDGLSLENVKAKPKDTGPAIDKSKKIGLLAEQWKTLMENTALTKTDMQRFFYELEINGLQPEDIEIRGSRIKWEEWGDDTVFTEEFSMVGYAIWIGNKSAIMALSDTGLMPRLGFEYKTISDDGQSGVLKSPYSMGAMLGQPKIILALARAGIDINKDPGTQLFENGNISSTYSALYEADQGNDEEVCAALIAAGLDLKKDAGRKDYKDGKVKTKYKSDYGKKTVLQKLKGLRKGSKL